MPFGASRRVVSLKNEHTTAVRTIQGWESRIATFIPLFKADGTLVSPLVLIFKGKGKKVTPEEQAAYNALPDIAVLWQQKAWIDRHVEKEVLRKQLKPEVKRLKLLYESHGKTFPGFLLVQDRGPGHDDRSFFTPISLFSNVALTSTTVTSSKSPRRSVPPTSY